MTAKKKAKAKKQVVKKINGKGGRVVEVRKTSFRRTRKDGTAGTLQTRHCVVASGGDVPVPKFLAKRGVTKGTQMHGCYSGDAAGKSKAIAVAERVATKKKL